MFYGLADAAACVSLVVVLGCSVDDSVLVRDAVSGWSEVVRSMRLLVRRCLGVLQLVFRMGMLVSLILFAWCMCRMWRVFMVCLWVCGLSRGVRRVVTFGCLVGLILL